MKFTEEKLEQAVIELFEAEGYKHRTGEQIHKELPEDILAEVSDFIQLLENKKERELLIRSSQKLSSTSFQRIWDNEEDSVYDTV